MARLKIACGWLTLALGLGANAAWGQGVGFAPQIGYAPDGAFLNVTPVVSADRRYVRMTLNPQFYGFPGFENAVVPAAVGGGGFNGGFGGFNGGGLAPGAMTPGLGMGTANGMLTAPSYGPLMGTIRSRAGRGRW